MKAYDKSLIDLDPKRKTNIVHTKRNLRWGSRNCLTTSALLLSYNNNWTSTHSIVHNNLKKLFVILYILKLVYWHTHIICEVSKLITKIESWRDVLLIFASFVPCSYHSHHCKESQPSNSRRECWSQYCIDRLLAIKSTKIDCSRLHFTQWTQSTMA
jgi:hypothetical protein